MSRIPASLLVVLLATVSIGQSGCATRTVRHPIIDRRVAKVDLVSEVKGISTRKPQGYEHPAIISEERLVHILNAIEIETQQKKGGVIRQPAFHPEIVEQAATALSEAFAQAGPDQDLAVKLVRKEMRLGVFHTKYLTSFIAYMQDGYLYLLLSRVEWPIPQAKENDKLPEPQRSRTPMNFRVVSGEHLFYAGPQTLEIAWQDPVFRKAYRLPGTSGGVERRREVLYQSVIPADEREATSDGVPSVESLTPEQLRALADLEEDRRAGRITEHTYQRAKRELLRER